MTKIEYAEWAEYHAKAFAFYRQDDALMFAAWWCVLPACTAADLTEATNRLLSQGCPWRNEHVSRLRKFTSPNDIDNAIHAMKVLLDFVQASPSPPTRKDGRRDKEPRSDRPE